MTTKNAIALAFIGLCVFFIPAAANAAEDTAAPEVTALSLTPHTVNTESADQTLTLTLTLTDDQAGVCIPGDCGSYSSSETQLRLTSTGESQLVFFTSFTRISGDDLNGIYTSTAILPQYSLNGVWQLSYMLLVDKLGNSTSLSNSELELAFGDGVGDVNNTATLYDDAAPDVTAFALSPSTVNTDDADAEITLSLTLTDQYAGVCIGGNECIGTVSQTQLRLISPNEAQNVVIAPLTRTSGDALNGTYTGTVILPQGSVPGTWSAEYFYLGDKIGNGQYLYKADLEAEFGTGVTDIFNAAIRSDRERPQITSFEITPTEINTSDESQTLTLTMTLTDNAAGVCIASDCGSYISSETQLRIRPLIGTQFIDFGTLTRISGNDLSGVYEETVTIPKSSKEGLWQVEHLLLVDKIGNLVYLYPEDLNTLFPEASGLTITNTAEASSVTIEREWTIGTAKATATFPNNTIVTKNDGGSFAFYKLVNVEYEIGSLTDNNLLGRPVKTIHLGIPGLNLEFSKDVTLAFDVGSEYNGKTLLIQALGEGEEVWANETTCVVKGGLCGFTVDHATYFTVNDVIALPQIPGNEEDIDNSVNYIVTGAKAGGGPQVTVWDSSGKLKATFMAYAKTFRGGVTTLMTDLDNDGAEEIITAPYSAGGPHIRVFNTHGDYKADLFSYALSYRGGLSLAAADVDNDGVNELIVAPATSGGPHVRIYDYIGDTFSLHNEWFAYSTSFRKGIKVNAGDVNGDGVAEIITSTNAGSAPHIRVFNKAGELMGQFYAFASTFRGGVNVTLADYNDDGANELIVTAASAGGPQVRVMKYDGTLVTQFFAYNQSWRLGLKSGAGDVDGDGQMEIVLAPSAGGPHIQVFGPLGLEHQFMAYNKAFRGGLELAVTDLDGNGKADIITAPMKDGGPQVRVFDAEGDVITQFMSFHPAFRGGVNLSVSQ
ncbi:MAG: VCBS repeat-containing protein [Patescibacteria group bacterium]|nr:VCBS repeat-containing protein [Patescibacteria group bacterium]